MAGVELPYNQMLVGGRTNPFEKYARQIASFPKVGMKIKILKTTNQNVMWSFWRSLKVRHIYFFPSYPSILYQKTPQGIWFLCTQGEVPHDICDEAW